MGKLRKEPKAKPFLSETEYQHYSNLLHDAKNAAVDNNVYYDLEDGEKPSRARKAFLFVAERENISVTIRRERNSGSLVFNFSGSAKSSSSRMSAEESRRRIISALANSKKPLQKAEVISSTGISPSTWNIRIKELIKDGQVKRTGDRRDTKYSLAS
jgi:hypothetical protein